MKVISFDDYQKKLMKQSSAHIYIEQDFAYDESGKEYLINLHKVSIIDGGKVLDKFEVLFGDFSECKIRAFKKCSNLSVEPSFMVHDLHRYDYKKKDFLLKVIPL